MAVTREAYRELGAVQHLHGEIAEGGHTLTRERHRSIIRRITTIVDSG